MLEPTSGVPASPPIPSIRGEIRARLKAVSALRASGQAWAQVSTSERDCAGCNRSIRVGERACQVEAGVVLHAHLRCFKLWVEEAHKGGPDAPPPEPEVDASAPSATLQTPAGRLTGSS